MELLNPLTKRRADALYFSKYVDVACLTSDSVGDFVAIRDVPINGKWRVTKADPGDFSLIPAIGMISSKSTPTVAKMQVYGPVSGVFSGLVPGKQYCLDYSGIRLGVPDLGINGYSFRQYIGFAVASDILVIDIVFDVVKHR